MIAYVYPIDSGDAVNHWLWIDADHGPIVGVLEGTWTEFSTQRCFANLGYRLVGDREPYADGWCVEVAEDPELSAQLRSRIRGSLTGSSDLRGSMPLPGLTAARHAVAHAMTAPAVGNRVPPSVSTSPATISEEVA